MVKVYVELILAGKKTFAQVPKKLQPAVKEELNRRGYDENGKPLV